MTAESHNTENINRAPFAMFTMQDSLVTAQMLEIVAEATDYTKKSFDDRFALFEKLAGAKSFDSAFRIQSEYAKSSFDSFVAQATKMGELYSNLAELYSNLAKSASIGLRWRWPTPKA